MDADDSLLPFVLRFNWSTMLRSSVRDRLRSEGVDIKLGGVNRFAMVIDVIEHFHSSESDRPASEPALTAR